MTAMVGSRSWWLRGCALFVATAQLAGCGRVILGTAQPLGTAGRDGTPAPVADLLIEPKRFPAQYPAAVLDGTAVHRALHDIDGVRPGYVVTPAMCTPSPLTADDTAAAQGMDVGTASLLIVAVTRPAPPLSARIEQLRGCPSFTATQGGDVSTVTVSLLPAPPVDADNSCAVEQTVTTVDFVRRTITIVAQIGDARVSATWLHDGAPADPDTAALDSVFSDAVLKVRRGG
jgi:hypothetical protein